MITKASSNGEKEDQNSSCCGDGSKMTADNNSESWCGVSFDGASSQLSDQEGEKGSLNGSKEDSESGILILVGNEEEREIDGINVNEPNSLLLHRDKSFSHKIDVDDLAVNELSLAGSGSPPSEIDVQEKANLSASVHDSDCLPSEIGSLRDLPKKNNETNAHDPSFTVEDNRAKKLWRLLVFLATLAFLFMARNRELQKENQQLKLELEEAKNAFLDWQADHDDVQTAVDESSWLRDGSSIELGKSREEIKGSALDLTNALLERMETAYIEQSSCHSLALELEKEKQQLRYELEEARNAYLDWYLDWQADNETHMTLLENSGVLGQLGTAEVAKGSASDLTRSLLKALDISFGKQASWKSSALQFEKENQQLKSELEEARSAYVKWYLENDMPREFYDMGSAIDLTHSLLQVLDVVRLEKNVLKSSSLKFEKESQQLKRELEEAKNSYLKWHTKTTFANNSWLRDRSLGIYSEGAKETASDITRSLLELLEVSFEQGNRSESTALQFKKENDQLKLESEGARKVLLNCQATAFQLLEDNQQLEVEVEEARSEMLEWQTSTVQLEEDNQQLKLEVEEARNSYLDCLLDWQPCQDNQTLILDTCFIRAGASVQLGECGETLKENAYNLTVSIYDKMLQSISTMTGTPETGGETGSMDDVLNTLYDKWGKLAASISNMTGTTGLHEDVFKSTSPSDEEETEKPTPATKSEMTFSSSDTESKITTNSISTALGSELTKMTTLEDLRQSLDSLVSSIKQASHYMKDQPTAKKFSEMNFGIPDPISKLGTYSISAGETLVSALEKTTNNEDLERSLSSLRNLIEEVSYYMKDRIDFSD